MSNDKVVVIIPTYNEALVIEKTVQEVFSAVPPAVDLHVLIFDSCSSDDTQSIIKKLQPNYPKLHLQSEPQKTGLGSAYLQAMNFALEELEADIVFEFDADLSHQPKYLLPIIEQLHSCDVVVASRYIQGGSIPKNWGWHRKALSKLGNKVACLGLTFQYKDFTSGFRATRHFVLSKALPKQFISNNYAYKLELFWRLHKMNAHITEYPIEFIDREEGYSKLPRNSILDCLSVLFILRWQDLKKVLAKPSKLSIWRHLFRKKIKAEE